MKLVHIMGFLHSQLVQHTHTLLLHVVLFGAVDGDHVLLMCQYASGSGCKQCTLSV